MTGVEFLKFIGDMRNMTDFSKKDSLIDRFELDPTGKIKKMSKGMKQKLGIVACFMHNPDIIVLDEPTSGLDPLMQSKFLELIQEEKKAGKTIMMSSHIFEEVQRVCDRVGIIKDGRIVAIEDVHSLKQMRTEEFIITTSMKDDLKKLQEAGLNASEYKNGILVERNKPYPEFLEILSKCQITGLEIKQQSLEDIFMKYYGREA